MKQVKFFFRLTILLSSAMAALYSCQKNITNEPTPREEQISASSNRPDDPGFAENDMVLYWNDKTSLVLGRPMPQPRRARWAARSARKSGTPPWASAWPASTPGRRRDGARKRRSKTGGAPPADCARGRPSPALTASRCGRTRSPGPCPAARRA